MTANVPEPPIAPNSLDAPTLKKCPNKELEVPIINDTKNTIHKLNLQIQNMTTELEAIKMFVKEQFDLMKKSLTKIDSQSEPQRNKEFIELLQQQNKNLQGRRHRGAGGPWPFHFFA